MATSKKPASAALAVEPTAAVKLAMAFDAAKSKVAQDVSRPVSESRTKQIACVGAVGAAAIGLWELAGF